MREKRLGRDTWKKILWITAMLIVIIGTTMWYRVISFNADKVVVNSKESDKLVYIDGPNIADSKDSWETGIQQSENPEDYIAYTGVL